jgi:hypothetical protein
MNHADQRESAETRFAIPITLLLPLATPILNFATMLYPSSYICQIVQYMFHFPMTNVLRDPIPFALPFIFDGLPFIVAPPFVEPFVFGVPFDCGE